MNNKCFLYIGLLLVGLNMPLFAEPTGYYRWVDESGNLKLSDRPPKAGINAEFISTPGSNKSRYFSSDAKPVTRPETPTTAPDPNAPTTMEVLPEQDPEQCKMARGNLAALSGNTRIRIVDSNGTKRFINDEERKLQLDRAKQAIELHCK